MTRNVHRWGAHLMVFFVFLHMMRVFYHGAYKPPREFNWVVGVLLLLMTIALSFTGYLLPWDQISYWAITIGLNMAGATPIINTPDPVADPRRPGGRARTRCSGSTCSTSWSSRSSRPSSLRSTSGGSARTAGSAARYDRPMTDQKTGGDAGRPAGRPDPADGDRQAARADVGAAVPAARDGQAGRRRPGPEGTRRHGHDLAAPALDRVPRGRRDEHLPAAHGPVHQRAARGARERQRDAAGREGAVVPARAAGAAGLLPPDRSPACSCRSCTSSSARSSLPYVDRANIEAKRPSERKTAVVLFSLLCILGLIVTFVGIFFRGPGYCSSCRTCRSSTTSPTASISPCDERTDEQLPPPAGRQAAGADPAGAALAAPGPGPGDLAPDAAAPLARRRDPALADRGGRRVDRLPVAEREGRLRRR